MTEQEMDHYITNSGASTNARFALRKHKYAFTLLATLLCIGVGASIVNQMDQMDQMDQMHEATRPAHNIYAQSSVSPKTPSISKSAIVMGDNVSRNLSKTLFRYVDSVRSNHTSLHNLTIERSYMDIATNTTPTYTAHIIVGKTQGGYAITMMYPKIYQGVKGAQTYAKAQLIEAIDHKYNVDEGRTAIHLLISTNGSITK